jgi:hypothetical protein
MLQFFANIILNNPNKAHILQQHRTESCAIATLYVTCVKFVDEAYAGVSQGEQLQCVFLYMQIQ